MSYGDLSTLLISPQQSFGTATTSWVSIPFINESLTFNRNRLVKGGMRGRFEDGGSVEGLTFVEGEFQFELQTENAPHFFRAALNVSTATVVDSHQVWDHVPEQGDWTTDSALPPFTIQVYRDVTSAFQLVDCIMPQIVFEQTAEETLKCTVSVIGKTSDRMAKTSPSYFDSECWTWDQLSLSIAGTANAEMEDVTVSINTNVEGVPLLSAEKKYSKFKRAAGSNREFLANGTINFDDPGEWDAFRAGTTQRFLMTWTGNTAIGSGYTNELTFDFPQMLYLSQDLGTDGSGRRSVAWNGYGEYNTSSSYAFRATVTNTFDNYLP